MSDDLTRKLAEQSDPNAHPSEIRFKLTIDGVEQTIIVPCPTPRRTWLWILEQCLPVAKTVEVGDLMTNIVLRIDEALCMAVGLRAEALAQLKDDERDDVLDRLAEQLGGELRNAAPFSNETLLAAQVALGRKFRMLLPRSAGTEQPTPSIQSSEAAATK